MASCSLYLPKYYDVGSTWNHIYGLFYKAVSFTFQNNLKYYVSQSLSTSSGSFCSYIVVMMFIE